MFYAYESDKWEVIVMATAGILALPFIIFDIIIKFFYKIGANHFILSVSIIVICWYIFAKFLGLKGREILYASDYLGGVLQFIFLAIFYFIIAGFIGNFILDFNWGFYALSKQVRWNIFYFYLFFLAVILFLRYGHKPNDLKSENKSSEELDEDLDKLKAKLKEIEEENEKMRNGEMPTQIKEMVNDLIEKNKKEEVINEIEKLKAENEALKKQLQDKENG